MRSMRRAAHWIAERRLTSLIPDLLYIVESSGGQLIVDVPLADLEPRGIPSRLTS